MVHVKLIAAGNKSTAHDALFQNELRRIFDDGCLEAIWAWEDEKASLKDWIGAERTRLDAVRSQVDARRAAIERETDRVERTFADLNTRIGMANAARDGPLAQKQRPPNGKGLP